MKTRINGIALVVASAVAVPAFAQPRPRDERRGAEVQRADERRATEVAHQQDPHKAALIAHRETEAEMRARLLKTQQDERARREVERKDARAWDANREQRALEQRSALQTAWGPALDRPDARAELNLHADRMARLNRILDVAQDKGDTALVAHTQAVIQKEIARDARVLHAIRAQVEGA